MTLQFKFIKKAARFAFADGGSIKALVLRSGIWMGASEVVVQVLSLGRSIVLARLLTPDIFGLMSLAIVVIGAIETFSRPGVGQALIARQQDFASASGTGFSLLMGRGVILAMILVGAGPWIAEFYGNGELTTMLRVLSLTFVIGSLNNINTVAVQRALDFRRLVYIGQSTSFINTVVSIALAYWLRSVWALVIAQVLAATVNTILSYVFVKGRIRITFDIRIARELLTYGKFITASSIVLFAASQLDSAVIAKLLGIEALGYYSLAFTISTLATLNLSRVASNIMFPAFSKLQSDLPALRRAYLRTMTLIMYAVCPAAAGLIVIAEPAIRVVYGEQWLPAVIPLQILAVFGVFRALFSFTGYLFEGTGRPRIAFKLGVMRLGCIALLIIPMTKMYGLAGTACTVLLGSAIHWFGSLAYLRQLLAIRPADIFAHIWRPMWTASAMAVAVILAQTFVDPGSALGLATIAFIGMTIYALLNMQVIRNLRNERM